MAPLAARKPYSAVAAPPFRTVIEATSSGLMSILRLELPVPPTVVPVLFVVAVPPRPVTMGIPSMTKRGWLFPVMEVSSLMKIYLFYMGKFLVVIGL